MQYTCRIGNQCSCSKIGVMWFLLGQSDTNRAAEFWTCCNLSKRDRMPAAIQGIVVIQPGDDKRVDDGFQGILGESLFYEANA